MKHIIKVYLILLFAVLSMAANALSITEAGIKAFVDKVNKASHAKNSQGVADSLSNNVIIIMNFTIQGKEHVMKPNKQEYIAMLQKRLGYLC